MRDGDDGAGVLGEVLLEPGDRLGVEVVRRLVEEEEVGLLEEDAAERDAAPLAAGDLRDVGVGGRAAEGVHRRLEGPVEVPAVRRLDGVLDPAVLGHDLLHLVVGEALAHLLAQLVEAREELLHRRDGRLDVLEDVLGRVEPRVLREEADARPLGREGLAVELLVDARHDPEQRRLPRAVQAEDADLGAREEGEVDPLQDLPLGRDDLPEVDHRVDVLRCHGETCRGFGRGGGRVAERPAAAGGRSTGPSRKLASRPARSRPRRPNATCRSSRSSSALLAAGALAQAAQGPASPRAPLAPRNGGDRRRHRAGPGRVQPPVREGPEDLRGPRPVGHGLEDGRQRRDDAEDERRPDSRGRRRPEGDLHALHPPGGEGVEAHREPPDGAVGDGVRPEDGPRADRHEGRDARRPPRGLHDLVPPRGRLPGKPPHLLGEADALRPLRLPPSDGNGSRDPPGGDRLE